MKARVHPPAATGEIALTGPSLRVRIPRLDDAASLFAAACDPEVTRWFSWGPYASQDEALAYLERLPGERERGVQLDLVVEHLATGAAIGITGFSEIARRDRRATIGTWLGRDWWGTGANREAKALMCHLGFALLGLDRIGSYTNVEHARSQRALEKLGFEREGVLRAFHRHGERTLDVVVFGLLRPAWEAGPLREIPVTVTGEPPPQFVSSGCSAAPSPDPSTERGSAAGFSPGALPS
jgi:[ribosomal protein S5]-alanine N-acetyltransferase